MHVVDATELGAHLHGLGELGAVTKRAAKEESPPSNDIAEGDAYGIHGDGVVVRQSFGRG